MSMREPMRGSLVSGVDFAAVGWAELEMEADAMKIAVAAHNIEVRRRGRAAANVIQKA